MVGNKDLMDHTLVPAVLGRLKQLHLEEGVRLHVRKVCRHVEDTLHRAAIRRLKML